MNRAKPLVRVRVRPIGREKRVERRIDRFGTNEPVTETDSGPWVRCDARGAHGEEKAGTILQNGFFHGTGRMSPDYAGNTHA